MERRWNKKAVTGILAAGILGMCAGCGEAEPEAEGLLGSVMSDEISEGVNGDVKDTKEVLTNTDEEENSAGNSENSGENADVSAEISVLEAEESDLRRQIAEARKYERFMEVLAQLSGALELPEIGQVDYDYSGNLTENQYAIMDVDGDGREELVINYFTASMAGQFVAVYDYMSETDILTLEGVFWSVTFYDNGTAVSQASHNHSYSMDFWPYTLYCYNPEKDIYELAAYVEAWDGELFPEIGTEKEPFPTERDTDGDGILYKILAEESYDVDDYTYNLAEYDAWYEEQLGGVQAILLQWDSIVSDKVRDYAYEYLELTDLLAGVRLSGTDYSPETDLGLLLFSENYVSGQKVVEWLEDYGVAFELQEGGEEALGSYEGIDAFRVWNSGSAGFSYENGRVGNATVFGLYPGMTEEEATAFLEIYGFYPDGEDNFYITGQCMRNRALRYEASDGVITRIVVSEYWPYAG